MKIRNEKGFTLIEVMVALAIMAALAVALTLLVSQVLDARSQLSEARQEGAEKLVDFLTRVDRQLNQLVVRRPHELGQGLGDGSLLLMNDARELYWVSAGQWVLPLQDYSTRLRLWRLQWDDEEEQLTLAASGLLDAAEEHSWTPVDRLQQVTDLNWAFYHQQSWQTTLPGGQLPAAVRLSLTWKGEDYQRLMLLPEAIRITPAGSSGGGDG
ncbi:type II secretion system minor pseudopilin GspJ [Marinospirillum sp.]|uniref:type II secretion system minor pseudopilin GspJ n=1 Tax=Marinospirillum sp. TaxID=2183934 RepID=UPI0038513177